MRKVASDRGCLRPVTKVFFRMPLQANKRFATVSNQRQHQMKDENSKAKGRGRILCVTSNFPRWAGDSTTPFVLNLAEDLQALGWQVDVLAPHAPGAARKEAINGVNVERFRYVLPESKQTVCYQGGALVNLRKRPLEKLKLPLLVAAEFAAITWRLLTRRYDVIHSHWILPQGFTGMLASKLLRVPHVITVHGGDIFSLKGNFMNQLKRAALRSANAVTVNSSFTRKAVEDLAHPLRNLQRIPMGVDASPLSDAERQQAQALRDQYRQQNGPLLVFVGRLVEEKGAQDAITAVQLLRERLPETRLLVIGEGQDRSQLEDQVAHLALQEHVLFLGWVEPKEVRAHMAAADAFLGPSRTAQDGWVEAQGLTFLEAMAAGAPVVASRLGGIVDSVRDGETGILVDEKSPQQIADAVLKIAASPGLRENFRVAAASMLTEEFSRECSASAFLELFEKVTDVGKHG